MQSEAAILRQLQLDEAVVRVTAVNSAPYEVEESLSAVERCALFLGANAEKVQVLHAIHSLPALVATHGRSIFQSVPVKRAASQIDDECSIALANVLQTILDESMLQKREVMDELLPTILQQFQCQKCPEDVWAAWYDVLMASAPHFGRQTAESALLAPALKQSSPGSDVAIEQRLRACRLLGPAAVALRGHDEALGKIVEHVRTLCQDLQHTVRECMCARVIVPLARSLGPDKAATAVVEDVLELIQDDHATVRNAALEALTSLLATLPPASRTACMPQLRTILKHPTDLALATAEVLASLMGTLPLSLRPLSPSDATLLHACYAHLATKGPPSVRLHCARAFPTVLTAPDAAGHAHLAHGPLLDSYTRFASDSDEAVRKSAAAQLHQLAMITPPDGGSHHLVKPLLTLLNDSSPAVLLSVLSHMPIVMSRLCLDANNYRDIVSALVATEEASARQWRLAVAIVAAIQEMVDEVPPAVIHDTLIPMVFRMLEHGARAVMAPAASAVCALFRRLSRERHRTEVLVHIIRDLAHSSSSVHRLAFVHVARAALATFSASFFCSHLLMHLLPLVHDASLAVRLALPAIMPDVKRTVRLPEGVIALEKVNAATSALLTDTDRRVCGEARSMHSTFKAVPVRLEGVGVLDIHGTSAKPADIAYEAADKELEAAEAEFTINLEEVTRACQSSTQIAAKAGGHDSAQAAKARRRGGGGGAGGGQDADDSATAVGGRLAGRHGLSSFDGKRPGSSTNASKGGTGKGISRKNAVF